MKILLILLLNIFFIIPVLADVYVRPYTKQDGTTVPGHYRSNPDGDLNNNWSTEGNTNPYTGQKGTRDPDNNSWGGNSRW